MARTTLQKLAGLMLLPFLAAPVPGLANPNPGDVFGELVAYVGCTMDLLQPSSAGIVVSQGEEIRFEAYLTGSFDGLPQTPVDESTLWALASATKSYGSGLLLTLVEDGIVDLDDPVSEYLPAFRSAGEGPFPRTAVNLRHLASHTSGLAYAASVEGESFDNFVVQTEPGAEFHYSSIGMHVLERVLEVATRSDYEDLLRQRILDPLGLANTRFVYAYDPELALIGASAGDFEDVSKHYFYATKGSRIGTGLYASTRDMNRYSQLWALGGISAEQSYFSSELIQEATSTHGVFDFNDAHYGILWWLYPEEGGFVMSGATHSVSAIVPEKQIVVTVTRNYFGTIPEAFSFNEDKRQLVKFASRLGSARSK